MPETGTRPAIRFGLGAVKNVGQGPAELIVTGRQNKIFSDLNDFARRVDLRSAGKRALECLIKVGAFDNFGDRAALLVSLERIVAASASHFRAVESGQLSLFGGTSGVQAESISLPTGIKVEKKEALGWERELIGVYLSDHPLSAYAELLTQAVSHNAVTLLDAAHQERVRVAGMVEDDGYLAGPRPQCAPDLLQMERHGLRRTHLHDAIDSHVAAGNC